MDKFWAWNNMSDSGESKVISLRCLGNMTQSSKDVTPQMDKGNFKELQG